MITHLDITRILAHTKYRLPTVPTDVAVYVVDGKTAADKIMKLLEGESVVEKIEEAEIQVGQLTKPFGIKGYERAEVGHPVFETTDRYVIYLSHPTFPPLKVSFYKETLKPFIK